MTDFVVRPRSGALRMCAAYASASPGKPDPLHALEELLNRHGAVHVVRHWRLNLSYRAVGEADAERESVPERHVLEEVWCAAVDPVDLRDTGGVQQ